MIPMTRLLAALLMLTLTTATLTAQETSTRHPLLEDRFVASAGMFIFDRDIKLSVNGTSDIQSDFDFAESTKLSQSDSRFSGTLNWRFGEKWSVATQYFDSSDGVRATLTEDIAWRDVVFREGTFVGAGIDITVARLFFGRTFSTGPQHEFGLGVGAHWLEIGAYIEGEALINDASTGLYRDSVDAAAPLPNLGGWYTYAFTPKWAFDSRVDWLSASFDEYSGSLWNASAGVQYQAFEHFGIALSYQYFSLDVDVDTSDWNGGAELTFNGPYLSLTANW